MSEVQALQAKATQAERLARMQTDPVMLKKLLALATEYKNRAHELTAAVN